MRTYRAAYALLVGPIPAGHAIHHTCNNPRCINPEHLEAMLPPAHKKLHAEVWASAKYCRYGHLYDEKNTYIGRAKDGRVFRQCRACKARRERERQQRLRNA